MSYEEKTLRVTRWPERVWVEKMARRGEVDERREYVDSTGAPGYASDGHHCFDDLYGHRAALSAALWNLADVACGDDIGCWKARYHSDGSMFGYDPEADSEPDMFVAGMTTPEGQLTYHYRMEWWDSFDVPELEFAPEYDGHSPEDVIERLLALF